MLEILLGIGMVVMMAKIASADDESPVVWGGLTFLLCVGSVFFVPLPFLRMLIAGVVAFTLMFASKFITKK